MTDEGVIIVFGASGDLSYKKTFPALYGLFSKNLLPENIHIIGYARSKMELSDFKNRVSSRIKGEASTISKFLERCWYVSGQYDQADSFIRLSQFTLSITKSQRRIFYMALPPSVFAITAQMIKEHLYTPDSHLIVEKPFGRDTQSSLELGQQLQKYWKEEQVYRIDHYLGKEMVKNLMVLRFGNVFFGAVWNRHYIHNVQITFKEPFGTQGRGGYL